MTRLEDELRGLFDRAATGAPAPAATDLAFDDVIGRANARAARTRRLAGMTSAALAVVMLAATVAAMSRDRDDRESELRVGADTPAASTTTTIPALEVPTISTPPISTPIATVPPVTVTAPRPVVTAPRATVPATTLRPPAGGGCDATNRAIDVAAVLDDGGLLATLGGGDVAVSNDLGATWTFHCGVLVGDGGTHAAFLEPVEGDVVWARLAARDSSQRPFARSADRGRSWTLVGPPVSGMQVYGASFVSPTTVWSWGVIGEMPVLYRTTDGTSWAPVQLPGSQAVGTAVFVDGDAGWATARSGDRAFSTVDGGASWQPANVPATSNILGIDAHDFDHVHLTAILADGRGAAVSTSDGGDTWNVTPTASTIPVAVAAIDDQAAVAVTQSSAVWHTLNGGETWTVVANLAEGPYSPRFVGAAGGRYAVVPSGQMFAVSDDDSRTWRRAIVR
ncbi:MAG TPA: YCF48-related protein [Acidimicrobiales bacterium]